jgi:hypothetical protein
LFAFFGCTGIADALKERGSKKRKELNNFIRACSLTLIKWFEFLVIVSMVSVKTKAVHKDDEWVAGCGVQCHQVSTSRHWSQLMAIAINCNYNQLLMGFGHPKDWSFNCTGG